MKLTVVANANHGPFLGGRTMVQKQEAAEVLLKHASADWWTDIAVDVAFDRDVVESELPDTEGMLEDWLTSETLCNRGTFVQSSVGQGIGSSVLVVVAICLSGGSISNLLVFGILLCA
jgi:hypothetical protein